MRRWLVRSLLGLLLVAAMGLGLARTFGYQVYVVHTGSMVPTMPIGSVVVDRPVAGPVRLRQVVTVTPQTGEVVTHRVAELQEGRIKTKGDANNGPDWWLLKPSQVLGVVVAVVPYAGYLMVFLQQPTGVLSLLALFCALVCAWSMFFGGAAGPGTPFEDRETARPQGRRPATPA